MTGLNHGLVGGLIGKLVPLPIALPLALASHFILDTLPHYGIEQSERDKSKFWKVFFTIDAFATLELAIYAIFKNIMQCFWVVYSLQCLTIYGLEKLLRRALLI